MSTETWTGVVTAVIRPALPASGGSTGNPQATAYISQAIGVPLTHKGPGKVSVRPGLVGVKFDHADEPMEIQYDVLGIRVGSRVKLVVSRDDARPDVVHGRLYHDVDYWDRQSGVPLWPGWSLPALTAFMVLAVLAIGGPWVLAGLWHIPTALHVIISVFLLLVAARLAWLVAELDYGNKRAKKRLYEESQARKARWNPPASNAN